MTIGAGVTACDPVGKKHFFPGGGHLGVLQGCSLEKKPELNYRQETSFYESISHSNSGLKEKSIMV